jgi:hypothetical protein
VIDCIGSRCYPSNRITMRRSNLIVSRSPSMSYWLKLHPSAVQRQWSDSRIVTDLRSRFKSMVVQQLSATLLCSVLVVNGSCDFISFECVSVSNDCLLGFPNAHYSFLMDTDLYI